jgi:hypothetical protein
MENKVERRWGIVLLAVVLFICTTIFTMAFKQKTSLYYIMWLWVGFYGYKGNLEVIKTSIKNFTLGELGLIAFIYLFVGNSELDFIKEYKNEVAINSLIVFAFMLVPSALIYLYCNKEIKPELTSTNSKNINPQFSYENTNIEKENTNQKNEIVMKKINEEEVWEIVAEEFDSTKRKKGLYAKLFADTNGDEIKIRAMYYKERVAELKKEANEIVVTEKITDNTEIKITEKIIDYELASDEECISKGWYEKEEIKGFTCFMLRNGKAVVDTEKKQIVYRNREALKSALATFRVSNKFSTTNMLTEINKS